MTYRSKAAVLLVPGLLAFWDFRQGAGDPFASEGRFRYALVEGGRGVERLGEGVFGPHGVRFRAGGWLEIGRAACPGLDLRGEAAQVTVAAWLRREPKGEDECQAVAGMWNETGRQRQYCLFLDLRIWDSRDQVCGHVSGSGGPTPGFHYCMDASIGATAVPFGSWHCAAFTYDGREARSYLDGDPDARPGRNPFPYAEGLREAGPEGADFTVGAVHRGGEMGNWFVGVLGGLAVFGRALSPGELRILA